MKQLWKVKAELNMDASRCKSIEIYAKTEKLAKIKTRKMFEEDGAFNVFILSCDKQVVER